MAAYTALAAAVDSFVGTFVAFSIPMYILLFALIFIALGKILSVTQQFAAMIFLVAASGAYLLMASALTVGAFGVTMSDFVLVIGVIFTGFVLAKSAKLVGF